MGDLFKRIIKPNVLHSREVVEDANGIPYVVRTKFNNGIKYRVRKNKYMELSPKGVISFGAENASFFYQNERFVFGRDIYYIDTQHLNEKVCLFLVTCLQTLSEKYSYSNGLFPDLLRKEKNKITNKTRWNTRLGLYGTIYFKHRNIFGKIRIYKIILSD